MHLERKSSRKFKLIYYINTLPANCFLNKRADCSSDINYISMEKTVLNVCQIPETKFII